MSDVRALLKAKRQEVRVSHPLASYSSNGQLRCIICGSVIKHASAWDGHLGTKSHRMNVLRLREEERLREEQAQHDNMGAKRKAVKDDTTSDEATSKRPRVDGSPADAAVHDAPGSFPVDFFSDSSRVPPPTSDDSDDGESGPPHVVPASNTNHTSNDPAIDLEWIKFQQTVVNAPDRRETYENATIFAEPELASEVPEGFPSQSVDAETLSDAPHRNTDEEVRRRKEQEERELIMDRLLDEERAQEEADIKVSVMKSRLDALKRKREMARLKAV